MLFTTIVHHYLLWHYTQALAQMWHLTKNAYWFWWHFFSVPQLCGSLLAPWRRMTEDRSEGFSFEAFASYLIVNILSRLVGAIIRSGVLFIALCVFVVLCFFSVGIFIFWFLAPVALVLSFYYGLILIL